MFAAVPRPSERLTKPWKLSLATLVRSHPRVPSIAGRLLRRFDTFGSVMIGPRRVGFDEKTIPWNRVIEIRVHTTTTLVPPVVLAREADRVRALLPPIPGRRWMVRKIARALLTVVTAFAPSPRWTGRTAVMLPCEIVYRTVLGRRASLSAGLFAAIVLAAIPEASQSLLTMAQARLIPVRAVSDRIGDRRAARTHRVGRLAAHAMTRLRMTSGYGYPAVPVDSALVSRQDCWPAVRAAASP
jgi:hypothetical protein